MSEGKVVMKLVVGCNGVQAQETADKLKAAWPVNPEQAYKIARDTGFGCGGCLTVITESDIFSKGDDDPPSPLFRKTFSDPEFNPRWEQGTADHTVIINV